MRVKGSKGRRETEATATAHRTKAPHEQLPPQPAGVSSPKCRVAPEQALRRSSATPTRLNETARRVWGRPQKKKAHNAENGMSLKTHDCDASQQTNTHTQTTDTRQCAAQENRTKPPPRPNRVSWCAGAGCRVQAPRGGTGWGAVAFCGGRRIGRLLANPTATPPSPIPTPSQDPNCTSVTPIPRPPPPGEPTAREPPPPPPTRNHLAEALSLFQRPPNYNSTHCQPPRPTYMPKWA